MATMTTANPQSGLYHPGTQRLLGTDLGGLWLLGLSVVLPWAARRSERAAMLRAQWAMLWPVLLAYGVGFGTLLTLRHRALPTDETWRYLTAGFISIGLLGIPAGVWLSLRAMITRVGWVEWTPAKHLVPDVETRARKALGDAAIVEARDLLITREGRAAKFLGGEIRHRMAAVVWVQVGDTRRYLRFFGPALQIVPHLTYNVNNPQLNLAAA